MNTRTIARLGIHIVAGAACASSILLFPLTLRPDAEAAPEKPARESMLKKAKVEDVGFPVRLTIPTINVDAAIDSVGLTPQGAMDLPADPLHVGWYNGGPRPGGSGSAVIAGHLDWYNGKTAVFQHLEKLVPGDLISVETDKGRFLLFKVREIRRYAPDEVVPEVFEATNNSHLNLITCDGAWDPVRKIYSKRMVVFADAVD